MNWMKPSAFFTLSLVLLQGCGIYSFSGILLSPKEKSFSLRLRSDVALGPPDLGEKLQQQLADELVQRTPLKRVPTKGDLQLEGVIKHFEYMSIAHTGEEGQVPIGQLTIVIQMSYVNPYNKEASFGKKIFSQHANMPANTGGNDEESRLIEEVFTKLVKDIFNETVGKW